jgi:hypothetical protein
VNRVLYLTLILAVVCVALMVVLFVGSMFLQGYIYTEPSPQMWWAAPAAGAVLGVFFAGWCYAVARSADARPNDIPYDTFFNFSTHVYMVKDPVTVIWAVKKNGEKVKYARFREDQNRYSYKDTSSVQRPWRGTGVVAIELEHDGEKYRFEEAKAESGSYQEFVNDKGWSMKVYESGPTGQPRAFRAGHVFANLFFNFMHAALWFVCLWLLIRFQWSHALGLAICLWLLFSLAILPMMLDYAARVAVARQAAATTLRRAPLRRLRVAANRE